MRILLAPKLTYCTRVEKFEKSKCIKVSRSSRIDQSKTSALFMEYLFLLRLREALSDVLHCAHLSLSFTMSFCSHALFLSFTWISASFSSCHFYIWNLKIFLTWVIFEDFLRSFWFHRFISASTSTVRLFVLWVSQVSFLSYVRKNVS